MEISELNKPTDEGQDNTTARLSGILYLSLLPLGIFGIIYVPSILFDAESITTTISNIMDHESLFRWSIISALVVQLVNIILAVLLFKIFRSVNEGMAALMVIFSLLAVPIAFLNEINNLIVLQLLDQTGESQELISVFLNLHHHGIIIAQIFWGLWLFPLGYLVYHSGYMPKFIGILLIIGSAGYIFDSFTLILFPHFKVTLSEFTFLGEVIYSLWLLIKGVK